VCEDQISEVHRRVCSAHEAGEKFLQNVRGLRDMHVGGRIILKLILMKQYECMCSGFVWRWLGAVGEFYRTR
jgi:hypothetical protein